MNLLLKNVRLLYLRIIRSIAFYPVLIATAFFYTALLMIYLEARGISQWSDDFLRYVIVVDRDSARAFLSTMAGGMISLTVFSFTMVMVMINQASSNYSPRIIPGIVSKKPHQIVLGIYLGTIIYLLMVLINISPQDDADKIAVLSVFIGFVFGLISLGLFFFFIHSISRSIQIETILREIYKKTRAALQQEIDSGAYREHVDLPAPAVWQTVKSHHSGYFQQIHTESILALLDRDDLVVDVSVPMGSYVLEGSPILRINSESIGKDSELLASLQGTMIFQKEELPSENYLFGFKQITEIAIKALSPGINDPGTAINAMDYLSDLFAVRMRLPDFKGVFSGDDMLRVRFNESTFAELLYDCFAAIREYGKSDPFIIRRLLRMVKTLHQLAPDTARKEILLDQARAVLEDAGRHIQNSADRERILRVVRGMDGLGEDDL